MNKKLIAIIATLAIGLSFASEKKPAAKAKAAKPAVSKAELEKGKKAYEMYCVSCHGASGAGDGVAAAALNPKPRNFTDAAYMTGRTDSVLTKVVVEGGAANNLSPLMSPWGTTLKPDEIKGVVAYIRTLAKK